VVTLFEGSARAAAGGKEGLTPLRSVMNLVTKVTATAFHPSGQLMAIASEEKKDHMKLVHLPSCTVFSNWPTERTPLGRVSCMDFSSGGAYLAVGNKKGRVLLYKVNHFSSA
jgi:U3 small nucleolar RNA-associated protein 18